VATDQENADENDDRRKEQAVEFADLPAEDEVQLDDSAMTTGAVLHATDWTTETVVSQLQRGTILLNPSFQRRDAWSSVQKSRFIESLILGLPIPQGVLAEARLSLGKFIVLDGKQRLLALLQFWGLGEGKKNEYALSGLEALKGLSRLQYKDLATLPEYEDILISLLRQPSRARPLRTVACRILPTPGPDALDLPEDVGQEILGAER
jgi:Protein of unknown function DUF262